MNSPNLSTNGPVTVYYVPWATKHFGFGRILGDWFTIPRTVNINFGQVDTWFPPLTSPKPAFYCFLLVGVATVHAENPVHKPVGDGFQALECTHDKHSNNINHLHAWTTNNSWTPENGHLEVWSFLLETIHFQHSFFRFHICYLYSIMLDFGGCS